MTTLAVPPAFAWKPQPAAQAMVARLLDRFLAEHGFARTFAHGLQTRAGVRFADLVDFVQVDPLDFVDSDVEADSASARRVGYIGPDEHLIHPGGVFPVLRLIPGPMTVGVRVDRVADFAATHQIVGPCKGVPGSTLRWLELPDPDSNARLWAVERHGNAGFTFGPESSDDIITAARWLETFRTRPRHGSDAAVMFADALAMIEQAKRQLSTDWVCDLFFQAERDFWMRRNDAARAQYARQQALGIGWANHDHHTYRCSRGNIQHTIECFEALGLVCRESFTPGPEAGWGAQVLEQPVTRIVVFADVDMSPDEVATDFAHQGLLPQDKLKTVGLWTALHGDSFLTAGMHHLECMFDFDALREQLASNAGVEMMPAFSNFAHLKQQFTQGQVWPVDPARVTELQRSGHITTKQADQFLQHGALGSHLENLERNDGFKGFNQTGITHIIEQTDPRNA